jgi:segregation and condensation protein B
MSEIVDVSVDAPPEPPASEVSPESIVEALLFSSDQPLPAARIAQILGIGDAGDVKQHIEWLNERYQQCAASFRIEPIAKGYQMLTLPQYNPWLSKLHKVRAESRLSAAALETLAIIAYKQPVVRADIEAIRGVAVGDMLVRLREMNLVRIVGRAEEIGRPLLYGTTNRFLEVFGLQSLKDLPKLDADRPDVIPPLKVAEDASASPQGVLQNGGFDPANLQCAASAEGGVGERPGSGGSSPT